MWCFERKFFCFVVIGCVKAFVLSKVVHLFDKIKVRMLKLYRLLSDNMNLGQLVESKNRSVEATVNFFNNLKILLLKKKGIYSDLNTFRHRFGLCRSL